MSMLSITIWPEGYYENRAISRERTVDRVCYVDIETIDFDMVG